MSTLDARVNWGWHGHDTTHNMLKELEIASTHVENLKDKVRNILCVGALCGHEANIVSGYLPEAEVFIVEAMTETYNLFLDSNRPCCPAKAKTFCKTVSDGAGQTTLYISSSNQCHSILKQHSGYIDSRVVETTTLESLCKENNMIPDLLMVDVEGATERVLRGAGDSILNHLWVVMAETEHGTEALFKGGCSDSDVDSLLVAHGMKRVSKIEAGSLQSNSVWVRI